MTSPMVDLNNALLDQLARLNNPEVKGEDLESEMMRAHAMTEVSKEIISNGRLVLAAEQHRMNYQGHYKLPKLLETKAEG